MKRLMSIAIVLGMIAAFAVVADDAKVGKQESVRRRSDIRIDPDQRFINRQQRITDRVLTSWFVISMFSDITIDELVQIRKVYRKLIGQSDNLFDEYMTNQFKGSPSIKRDTAQDYGKVVEEFENSLKDILGSARYGKVDTLMQRRTARREGRSRIPRT
jgi:hypothetical protein